MEPLSARSDEGLLWLSLDTPGSDVNVFDLRAATALEQVLGDLPGGTEAIVLTSTKPGSFVNGVGLMMAGAVKQRGDVARLTEPVRRAYRALREARVPTIAAIRGNCFGCGVELALQCRYRVAVDDGPTSFYMTEIADYLFVPCFGATQDLPRVVGLDAAIRLLVGGERWSARDAARGGLVDRVVAPRGSDEAIRAFAMDARAGRVPSRVVVGFDPHVAERARVTAASLPAPQRAVSERAIDLMVRAAAGERAYEEEIVAAEESVSRPVSKAAQGFFFVRQIAAARERRASTTRVSSLVLAGLPMLADLLGRIAPLELPIAVAPATRPDPSRLLLASSDGPGVDVVLSTGAVPPSRSARLRAWAPRLAAGARFVEIDAEARPGLAATLAQVLQRAGLETATTHPRDRFVSERLTTALLDPIDRHLERGGTFASVRGALRSLGIARPPLSLPPAKRPELELGDAVLESALAASLVAMALDVLARGEVAHPATLDVIARHVVDFPLAARSLTSFATTERAGVLVERHAEIAPLVEPWVLERLAEHARGGRDAWS